MTDATVNLAGGVAVVTGGGSGLGRALASAAARRGMKVLVADIEHDALQETVRMLHAAGAEAIDVPTDVADAGAVKALADRAAAAFDRPVQVLFNNAGVTSGGLLWESTEKDWDWLLGVNLKGVIHGVRSFVPAMLAAAAADPAYRGCVVNTASMAGLVTSPGMGIYSVSKHAVVALTECLHHDLGLMTRQVAAAVLCPSYVATDIGRSQRNRPERLADAGALTKSQVASRAISQEAIERGALSPDAVAAITLDAVEAGRFWVIPSPEALPLVRHRADSVLEQTNPDLPYEQVPSLSDRRDRLRAAIA